MCVSYGVTKAVADVETLVKERVLPTKVTKACRDSEPPRLPVHLSCVSLPLLGGGC